MKRYRIPNENHDLRKYALWKNSKYLLFFVIYVAFFCYAFIAYAGRRPEDADPLAWWIYLLFLGVVLLSGWIICCMGRFLFDRSFTGKIQGTRFVRNYGRGLSRRATMSVDFHTYLKITAVTDSGRRKRVSVPLFDDGYDGYYREDCTIVKFRGLTYPLCLESEAEGAHICGVCGVRTFYKEGKVIFGEPEPEIVNGQIVCRCCRHTLIDVDALIKE